MTIRIVRRITDSLGAYISSTDSARLENALSLVGNGAYDEGFDELEVLAEQYPMAAELAALIAHLYYKRDMLGPSCEWAARATALAPYAEHPSILLFLVLWEAGEPVDACLEMRRFLGLSKRQPREYKLIVQQALRGGDRMPCVCRHHARGRPEIHRAVEHTHRRELRLSSRVSILRAIHLEFADATEDAFTESTRLYLSREFERLTTLGTGFADYLAALSLLRTGMPTEALAHAERAKGTGPSSEAVSIACFLALWATGRAKPACEEMRRFFTVTDKIRRYSRIIARSNIASGFPCICGLH